jgi:hypothetical protein
MRTAEEPCDPQRKDIVRGEGLHHLRNSRVSGLEFSV